MTGDPGERCCSTVFDVREELLEERRPGRGGGGIGLGETGPWARSVPQFPYDETPFGIVQVSCRVRCHAASQPPLIGVKCDIVILPPSLSQCEEVSKDDHRMRFAKLVITTNDRIREAGRFTDENACTFIVTSGSIIRNQRAYRARGKCTNKTQRARPAMIRQR